MNHIFLYGPPGSGKSTVGKALAEALCLSFVDLDVEIEKKTGSPVYQIISEWGETAFRNIESGALQKVIKDAPSVIALGGGALLRAASRARAEAGGMIVCLEADIQILKERLINDPTKRPLLIGDLDTQLNNLLERRSQHYKSFDIRVPTDGLSPEDIALQIQMRVGRFRISGMGQPYDVIVQPGGFDGLGELMRLYGLEGPVVIVSDENVAPLYAERVSILLRKTGYSTQLITIPPGESSKNIETINYLWRGFLEAGLDRKSTVLALGGGVVGDLAGFAAATFMRGVSWVCVPSSLLAMVDASLGGKTGFDLPEGKNLVGTFYPPRLVYANPYMLSTLDDDELRSGLAEVIKHGIIADSALIEMSSAGFEVIKATLPELVRRAMAVKVQIIEADPFEKGFRAALNYGHTVGHAIEKVSSYSIRHGEAVAIGMVVEARLAERLWIAGQGLSEQIGAVLKGLGLPTEIPPELSREELIKAMLVDKKRSSGIIRFALPEEIGEIQVGVSVNDLNMVFDEPTASEEQESAS